MFDPELQDTLRIWIVILIPMFMLGMFGFATGSFPGGIKGKPRMVSGQWGYGLGLAYMLLNGVMLVLLPITQFAPQHAFSQWLAAPVMTLGTEPIDRSTVVLTVWIVGVALVHLLSLFVPDEN